MRAYNIYETEFSILQDQIIREFGLEEKYTIHRPYLNFMDDRKSGHIQMGLSGGEKISFLIFDQKYAEWRLSFQIFPIERVVIFIRDMNRNSLYEINKNVKISLNQKRKLTAEFIQNRFDDYGTYYRKNF